MEIPKYVKAGKVDGRDVLYMWEPINGEFVEIARAKADYTEHLLEKLNSTA